MDTNPLQQYFRQPAIFIRLPSNGKFYPPGALTPTANEEYPVLPMTTKDEITYRTPDALFNGAAIVSVIESCVPNITNAWLMPGIDVDTVLTAIRVASYGHNMEINVTCPSCKTESDYNLDLRQVMEQISVPDYTKTIPLGDLELYFKPMNYQEMNNSSLQQFEDQKTMSMLQDSAVTEQEKMKVLGTMLTKITDVTVAAVSQNIAMIRTPQTQVTDPAHIAEWLANCDRKIFNRIRDHVIEGKKMSEIKPLEIECSECSHKYQQVYTLDMSNFFADAS